MRLALGLVTAEAVFTPVANVLLVAAVALATILVGTLFVQCRKLLDGVTAAAGGGGGLPVRAVRSVTVLATTARRSVNPLGLRSMTACTRRARCTAASVWRVTRRAVLVAEWGASVLLLVTGATAGYASGRVGFGVTRSALVVPFACSFGL